MHGRIPLAGTDALQGLGQSMITKTRSYITVGGGKLFLLIVRLWKFKSHKQKISWTIRILYIQQVSHMRDFKAQTGICII